MDVKDLLTSKNPLQAMNEAFGKSYSLYAQKAADTAKASTKKKSNGPKKTGFVRASGKSSVESLRKMLSQLDAKFREVSQSDVDSKLKEVFLMDIRREMNNLEGLIREVRQKEIRQANEKTKREQEERKRKTESKSLLIKKGYLYSIEDGGFDPSDYDVNIGGGSSPTGTMSGGVSASLSAGDISISADMPAATADIDVSV